MQKSSSINMCDTQALITTKQTSDLHSCWIIYTKSDGRERLTVTDTKPVIMAINPTTDLTNNNNNNNVNHNPNSNNNDNNITNGLQSHNIDKQNDCVDAELDVNVAVDLDVDADEDSGCGYTEQSLADILDPELQPEPPIPNNAESQAIYRDHRHMAREYLSLDTNLYYAQDFKDKLILQMDRPERELKQEILRKSKDKEGLQSLYNNLQQQWEKLPAAQQARLQPPAINNSGGNSNSVNQDQLSSGIASGESVENDGWVVIAPHHNT